MGWNAKDSIFNCPSSDEKFYTKETIVHPQVRIGNVGLLFGQGCAIVKCYVKSRDVGKSES